MVFNTGNVGNLDKRCRIEMLKWIEIDLGAIRSNLRQVRRRLAPGVRLMGVVKADGYGHGAAEVARALGRSVDSLGCLTVSEGIQLRSAGLRVPIHILSPALPEEAQEVVRRRLIPTLDALKLARALDLAASRLRRPPLDIHLDLDSGLGRWGIPPREAGRFVEALRSLKNLRLAGLSTHLDYVPGTSTVEAETKLKSFERSARGLRSAHPLLVAHAANSSVLLDFPQWQLDMVRIGNLLYGIPPRAPASDLRLANPWRFLARIISVRDIRRGASVGYASEYVASRRMRVATVPVGYSDGLTMEPVERLIGLRAQGAEYWGWLGSGVRPIRTPFIGRAGISHVLLDVSAAASAKPGDVVSLPVRRTAASARIPRVYI